MASIHELDDYEPEVDEKPKVEKKKKKKEDAEDEEEEEKTQVKKELPDCYKILGIEEKGYDNTADEIKKAFRKLSLIYHPDKAAQNDIEPEEAEERMKEIQEAYNILTTPELKKILDSDPKKLPKGFDRIPSGEEDGDFFEIYTEPFQRFSRWSEVQPVPQLGDANTPIEEVDAFYDFWYEFKSWRILTGNPKKEEEDGKPPEEGEYDPDQAEDAYERRWMKTENERERRRLKKQHMKTIASLRDLAFKKDPRVIAARTAEREKVEAEKQAKLAEKLKREAEAKAIADAGKTPKELAAEAAAQAKRDEERKKLEDKKNAQLEEKAAGEDQAAKVQAAILARQKKAKESKAANAKKKAGPQSKSGKKK